MNAEDRDPQDARRPRTVRFASGIGAGIALGVALGAAMGNRAAGLAIGIVMGVAIGVALDRAKRWMPRRCAVYLLDHGRRGSIERAGRRAAIALARGVLLGVLRRDGMARSLAGRRIHARSGA